MAEHDLDRSDVGTVFGGLGGRGVAQGVPVLTETGAVERLTHAVGNYWRPEPDQGASLAPSVVSADQPSVWRAAGVTVEVVLEGCPGLISDREDPLPAAFPL